MLVGKVDNMQGQIGNVNREMETLIRNLREMLEIKNSNRNKECL